MAEVNEELTRRYEEEYSESAQERKAEAEREWQRKAEILGDLTPLTERTEAFNNLVTGEGYKEKVPTGLTGIDLALNGGLSPRLYLVSADTGKGKSTLVWNIAQNIARQTARDRAEYDRLPPEERARTKPPKARSVLYFLMEMTAEELFARAISRRMLERNADRGSAAITPLTEDQILYQYQNSEEVSPEQQAVFTIEEAKFLQEEAPYLFVIEGRKTVEDIADYIQTFCDEFQKLHPDRPTEAPPVVIVDYLQILAPTMQNGRPLYREPRLQVDHNTGKFVEIKTRYGTPIILISSVTKQGQGSLEIDITDLKESGTISFDVDVVMTLNPAINEDLQAKLKNARSQDDRTEIKKEIKQRQRTDYPRKMTLLFEKNRGGIPGTEAKLVYYSAHNAFYDDPEAPEKTQRRYTGKDIIPPPNAPF